ncbi:murein hydrolase activator EnvC [Quadrisphaera sp. DSM 44207]|uniref:murein hydrolase activator EnvC family protein n=1 Tax=Quadrisphaera sp. DSM 44207 TaxID=1881057 RepID=UPI00088C3130|nr:M23 family metallopeptidase [Quadrisphaera sp. DSM 44207]SDQ76253.1 Peptidase family M23 [Quadrisphaera sp. DSM 44207]
MTATTSPLPRAAGRAGRRTRTTGSFRALVVLASLVAVAASCAGPTTARAVPTATDGAPAPAVAAPMVRAPASSGAPPDAVGPAAGAWGWPLPGSPQVLRGFEPPPRRWSPGHRGADLAAEPGSAVLAPVDGVVVFAGTVVDRGVVSVRTAGGLRATLEPVVAQVAPGARVRRGDVVGHLAAAPQHCPQRACLHWGVRAGRDAYRDPLALLAPAGPPVLLPLGPGVSRRP